MEEKDLDFEKSLTRLEEIVKKMESAALPLAQMLSLYEEGVSLTRALSAYLEDARRKVTELRMRADGEWEEIGLGNDPGNP